MKALVTHSLLERVSLSPGFEVDRDNFVLRGVKILGTKSRNKRRYTDQCLESAIKLYENKPLKRNHPPSENEARKQRDPDDTFGWIRNVTRRADGLYGDAEILREDAFGRKLMESAHRNPELFCLSHNADGQGHIDETGTHVIESIPEVRSVDVIEHGRGGTTTSLFESHNPMKKTLKDVLAASRIAKRKFVKALLEMDGDPMMDMPIGPGDGGDIVPGDEPVVEDDWKTHLTNAIAKLVESDAAEDHALAQKILALLKPQEAKSSGDNPFEGEEEDEETAMESIRELCDLAGVNADTVLLESLLDIRPKRRIAFIKREKSRVTRRETPTSGGQSLLESKKNEPKQNDLEPPQAVIDRIKGGI